MYPIEVYELVIIIDVILFIYAFVDINQKFYGNIISLGLSTLLSAYLAIASTSSSIVINYASTTATGGVDYLQDPGLQWLFILIAIIQATFTIYLSYDAYSEYAEEKINREWGFDG